MNRRNAITAAYALSYVCVAFVAAGLGPLIPIKAEQMNRTPTDFKWAFVFKGVGCLIGTLLGLSIEKLGGLHRTLAIAYLLVGGCALITYFTTNMLLYECVFLLVEMCKMLVNVASTVCILRTQTTGEAWVKSFHFCYGVGAFVSPLIIKAMKLEAFWVYAAAVVPVVALLFVIKPKFVDKTAITSQTNILQNNTESSQRQVPMKLNILLAALLFFTTGNEAAFAGWLTSYGRMGDRLPLATCLLGESIFWVAMSVGRGMAIPLSMYWSNRRQMTMLIAGLFLTIFLCNILSWLSEYLLVMYVGSALMGLFASSVYPLTMSMPASLGLRTEGRNTSLYAMGGCFGVTLLPFAIGLVMEYSGPNSLFLCMQAVTVGATLLFFFVRRTTKQVEAEGKEQVMDESQITTSD